MSDAKHTAPGDGSFRTSLLRNGAGALGLVVIVAAAFWAIGTLGGDGATPLASDGGATAPDEEPTEPEVTDGEAADDDAAPDDEGETAEVDDDADGDAGDDATEDDEEDADASGDDGEAEDDAADDGAAEELAVAPAEVTIQVLDGYKEDGGTAADEVADLLTGAGYDIIARNDALSYDATTVLYNAGHEEAARQVAAALGGAEVREQPGNLSTSVALHVVVGRDRA